MNLTKPAHLLLSGACALALMTSAWGDNHTHGNGFAPGDTLPIRVADRDNHRGPLVEDRRGAVWGHGDIHHFHVTDLNVWRGGHWTHEWHNGHLGWWWVVGGAWIFFTAPVYPYPDPYTPPTVIVQNNVPPAAMAPAAPPPPAAAQAPVATTWYYCASAQNYYPYVTSCPVAWQAVPATPAATPAAPPPGAPPAPPAPGGNSNW